MMFNSTMNFKLTIAATLLLAASACDFNPAGLRLGIQVDTLGTQAAINRNQYLRLALWFGPKAPVNGDRPAGVFHKEENNDTTLGAGNPEETCLQTADQTQFDCVTHVLAKPGSQLWVGAFYEYVDAIDNVPDDGEFLSLAGPITVESAEQHIQGIVIKVVDPHAVSVPAPEAVLADLTTALVDGNVDAFMQLVHPFFYSDWNLDYQSLAAWVTGAVSSSDATDAVTFANPLSAPLAGFLSPDVRSAMDLKGVTLTEVEINVSVATVDVFYVLREGLAPEEITERWKISTTPALDQRLISRIDIVSQERSGIKISKAVYEENQVVAEWSGSTVDPGSRFSIGLDIFDPATRLWQAAGEVTPSGTPTSCSFGPTGSCINNITTPTDGFYRVRVAPVSAAGVTSPAGSAYTAGPDYLP